MGVNDVDLNLYVPKDVDETGITVASLERFNTYTSAEKDGKASEFLLCGGSLIFGLHPCVFSATLCDFYKLYQWFPTFSSLRTTEGKIGIVINHVYPCNQKHI